MLIKKPLITEKTVDQYKKDRKVTFEVDLKANKTNVTSAIEDAYGVEVEKAWVINRIGKDGRNRITRQLERSKDQKFIVLKLKEGSKIDLFESK